MKTKQGTDTTDITTTTTINGKALPLDVDLMTFAHHLDESDLTDDEKQEFLGIFWNLVMAFVDLGYGVNSTQMACGHLTKSFEKEGVLPPDSVKSEQSITPAEEGACS
ncbi:hypothetical protein [Epibacterium ulvae]|uniref:hypothetical protein n=1 Tax=Epibacterium ulvae TaxID=1156985 RepID=UPI00249166D1|nr:hypothetical protein [Epibacterium ulvae]